MKKLYAVLLTLLALSCSKNKSSDNSLIDKIPEKTEYLISTPDLNNFAKELNNNKLISSSDFGIKTKIQKTFSFFQNLHFSSSSLLSLWEIEKESPEYLLVTKQDSTLVSLEKVKNKSVETINSNGFSYKKYQLTDATFYLYENEKLAYISNKASILKEAIKNIDEANPELKKAYDAADPAKTSIIFKNSSTSGLVKSFFEKFGFLNIKVLGSWIVLDLDINENTFKLNGISLNAGKENTKQLPVRNNEALQIIPDNFITWYSFGFSTELVAQAKDSVSIPPILNITQEIAKLKIPSGEALILNTTEAETAKENMAGNGEKINDFRNMEIFKLNQSDFFKNLLEPFLKSEDYGFYSFLDHFVIFSKNEEVIRELITANQNSSTLIEKNSYKELSQSISSQGSMLFLANLEKLQQEIKNEKDTKTTFNFNKKALGALQFINDKNFAHVHAVIQNDFSDKSNTEDVSQSLVIQSDSPIVNRPFFFKNHLTDQMDIAFQDEENNLFLYSNRGNLHWKKKLDSRINGEIYQVDLFKNGYQQLAFSTAFQLDVLDRNGNRVKPFPIKFNDQLTQPLSIFDYDSNRNYRFVMVQGRNLYMVGPRGKGIKGFNFEKAKSEITLPPTHIRLNTKDYILVAEESGKLNILSRQGNIRVPVKETFDFSENQWYGYNNHFISTSPEHIIEIDQNGNVNHSHDLAENNRLVANDRNLVYLNENELHINNKTIELDYGLYTTPQILSVSKKTFIAITDTQTQRVFVFNTDGDLLEGFPVYGTSQIDIANADTDDHLELLVKGDDKEIIIYDFL